MCVLCNGLRGHNCLKHALCVPLNEEYEYKAAEMEYQRLKGLFEDACWYNFEVQCNRWSSPWAMSIPSSTVELRGMRFVGSVRNDGNRREVGEFPEYYSGVVVDASALPPQILYDEVQDALRYMEWCAERVDDPFTWAPGGSKYKELLATTIVPTKLSESLGTRE